MPNGGLGKKGSAPVRSPCAQTVAAFVGPRPSTHVINRKPSRRSNRSYVKGGLILAALLGLVVALAYWYEIGRINRLTSELQDPASTVRAHAADELDGLYLGDSGPLSTLPGIIPQYLRRDKREMRLLLALLKDPNAGVREAASRALAAAEPPPPLPPIIALMKSRNDLEREAAVSTLGSILFSHGDLGQVIAPPLVAALGDSDSKVSRVAVDYLGCGEGCIEPLLSETEDSDSTVRLKVFRALFLNLGGEHPDPRVKAAFLDVLNRQDTTVIAYYHKYFIGLGVPGSEDALIKALGHSGTGWRTEAMAEDFLNCGNPKLEAAAQHWAAANGYEILTGRGRGPDAIWGSDRP